jgi:hypothetical protein
MERSSFDWDWDNTGKDAHLKKKATDLQRLIFFFCGADGTRAKIIIAI